jgi:hypothetical protein
VFIPVKSVTVADPPKINMAKGQIQRRVMKLLLTADDDVCGETEEHEDEMGDCTPSSFDDFEET